VRLLVEFGRKSAGSSQRQVEIIDAEKQEQSISRQRLVRARQGRMPVRAPLVETQQHGAIRVANLTPEVVTGSGFRLSEQCLVPFEAERHISDTDDCPGAFHFVGTIASLPPTFSLVKTAPTTTPSTMRTMWLASLTMPIHATECIVYFISRSVAGRVVLPLDIPVRCACV
jgi:hypothetical protein